MKRLGFLAAGAAALLMVGCGGGDSLTRENTLTRIKSIDTALGSGIQFDPIMIMGTGAIGHGGMSDTLNGFFGSNDLPAPGFASDTYSRAKATGKTRAEGGAYYDGYLKLWTKKTQTDTDSTREIRYDFYVDEALTQPGGFISSQQPNWDFPTYDVHPEVGMFVAPQWQPKYPVVYKTTYEFTEGTLKGSNGFSENISREDFSFDSRYENNYADGWKDRGNNHSDNGSTTWFSRIETADGQFAEGAGSFRSNVGGTRLETSDGYKADYQFSGNGSGHGKVEGNAPGLPVTLSWSGQGQVLVRYADGTTESFQRQYRYYPDHDGGSVAAGTGSGGGGFAEINGVK